MTLQRSSGDNLTSLHIKVDAHDTACLALLPRFSNLTEMSIDFAIYNVRVQGIPLLKIPRVTTVSLVWNAPFGFGAEAVLFGCHFPDATSMHLRAPGVTHQHLTYLETMLRAGTQKLALLSVHLSKDSFSKPAVARVLSEYTHHLKFEECIPRREFFEGWQSMTLEEISIKSSLRKVHFLWSFLDHFTQNVPAMNKYSLRIHVALDDFRFTWHCGHQTDERALFAGKIMSYALALDNKGVLIVDEDGKTLSFSSQAG
jgi:hypothetical protein